MFGMEVQETHPPKEPPKFGIAFPTPLAAPSRPVETSPCPWPALRRVLLLQGDGSSMEVKLPIGSALKMQISWCGLMMVNDG